jgi:hypothetical protein
MHSLLALASTAAAAAAVAHPSSGAACVQRYVSPTGNDANAGTLQAPFRTIQRGVADLAAGNASTLNLLAGTYFLSSTVDMSGFGLGPDSLACPPTIAAYPPGAAVTVSGGMPIPPSAFAPYTGGGGAGAGALAADLSALGVPVAPEQCSGSLNGDGHFYPARAVQSGMQLYDLASDAPMTPASFPPSVPVNSPYTSIFLAAPWVDRHGGPGGNLAAIGFGPNVSARIAAWAPQLATPSPDVWAHGNWQAAWADATYSVVSWSIPAPGPEGFINGSFSVNTTDPSCTWLCDQFCQPSPGATFSLINLLAEVQRPGDYYINRTSNVVVAIPPSPSWLPVASVLPVLFQATGAANLVLSGLALRHARAQLVLWTNCTNCTVTDGSLAFAGAQCMNVSGGVASGLVGATVTGCGVGGVFLDGGDRPTLTPSQHFVRNANISNYNLRVWDNTPGVILSGVACELTDSELHMAPHQAVYAMGNEHVVARNYFHDVVLHSCDAGAFYYGRDWTYRGNLVVDNVFENINSDLGCPAWFSVAAVYGDDGVSGLVVAGNRFVNVARAVRAYGGRSHRIENNTASGILYDYVQMDNLPSNCADGSTQLNRLLAMPFNTSAVWLSAYSAFPDNLPPILQEDPCNNHFAVLVNNSGCGVGGVFLVPHNVSQIEAWGGIVQGNNITSASC